MLATVICVALILLADWSFWGSQGGKIPGKSAGLLDGHRQLIAGGLAAVACLGCGLIYGVAKRVDRSYREALTQHVRIEVTG